jgi:hypothetical protein
VPPSHRRGEPVPAVLEAAVLKCLEKIPTNRFTDGDVLAAALRADRAVELVTPRFDPDKAERKRKSRALQMLPAFMMAAAAAALHFAPRSDKANAAPAPAAHVAAAPTPAPAPAPTAAPAEVVAPPAPPALTEISVTLVSNPEGAQLYMGDEALGESPAIATIKVSSKPVTLTAKFPDGTEVKQVVVPDRPLAQIAFVKPQPAKPPDEVATTKQPPVGVKPQATKSTRPKPQPSHTDKLDSRDGTMDPFGK